MVEVTEGWRGLHTEELHNLKFSPVIIIIRNSIILRYTELGTRMGRRGINIGFWCGNPKTKETAKKT
jgi:hypothetical protein